LTTWQSGFHRRDRRGFIEIERAGQSDDELLKNFALSLPDNFVIADLRNKPVKSGFAWGRFGPDIDDVKRHDTEPKWGLKRN